MFIERRTEQESMMGGAGKKVGDRKKDKESKIARGRKKMR